MCATQPAHAGEPPAILPPKRATTLGKANPRLFKAQAAPVAILEPTASLPKATRSDRVQPLYSLYSEQKEAEEGC